LDLGAGRGVRDLATWKSGLLILAGPSESQEGDYSIFRWGGVGDALSPLGDLPRFHKGGDQLKPEALLPLDASEKGLRVLILFDGAKRGAPRSFFVENP